MSFRVDLFYNIVMLHRCSPELVRIACTLINDAYFSSTCIAVPPYIIAVTCLYIAASSVPVSRKLVLPYPIDPMTRRSDIDMVTLSTSWTMVDCF